jgi:Spy/CpxP family protein refolding chaperone
MHEQRETPMKMMNLAANRMRSTALALCAFAIGTSPMWSQAPQEAPPPPPQNDGGAPPPHPRMEHMQEHRIEMMTKHLGLTPDQVTQVKAIDKDGQTQMMALRQDTSIAPPDKHAKMKAIHEAQTAKIRAALTDEQKPKFDAMIAHQQERMEHRRGGEGPQGEPMNPPPPPA